MLIVIYCLYVVVLLFVRWSVAGRSFNTPAVRSVAAQWPSGRETTRANTEIQIQITRKYKNRNTGKYNKYIDKVRSVAAEWAGDNSCKYKEHTRECKYKKYKEIQIQMFRKYKYRNTRKYRKIQTNILTKSDQ